jgi:hypothetical protein
MITQLRRRYSEAARITHLRCPLCSGQRRES